MQNNTWRNCNTDLMRCSSQERGFILAAIKRAEQNVLQTAVECLCAHSPIGLVDCAHLRAEAKRCRWIRRGSRIYVECVCLLQPSGVESVERFKSPVRGNA